MLCDDMSIRVRLRGIITRMAPDGVLREDLMQMALIHLWLMEEQRPFQTESWYLQSCKFHLMNWLAAGRSIDSLKRKRGRVSLNGNGEDSMGNELESGTDVAVLGPVSTRDIMSVLSKRLPERDQTILNYLSLGLGARDIAKRLKISHAAVIKRRKRIAAQAIRLGIAPLPKYRRHIMKVAAKPRR